MDPSAHIEELCRRHGVSPAFGKKLLPLVRRSGEVAPDAGRRILDLVERSFVEEARRTREEERRRRESDLRALSAVAGILHDWCPPGWLQAFVEGTAEDDADED